MLDNKNFTKFIFLPYEWSYNDIRTNIKTNKR